MLEGYGVEKKANVGEKENVSVKEGVKLKEDIGVGVDNLYIFIKYTKYI